MSQPARVSSGGPKGGKGFDIVFDDAESLSQANDRENYDRRQEKSRGMGVEITFDDMKSLSQANERETVGPRQEKSRGMGVEITFDDAQSLSQLPASQKAETSILENSKSESRNTFDKKLGIQYGGIHGSIHHLIDPSVRLVHSGNTHSYDNLFFTFSQCMLSENISVFAAKEQVQMEILLA